MNVKFLWMVTISPFIQRRVVVVGETEFFGTAGFCSSQLRLRPLVGWALVALWLE